jgi:thiosulfate/3-mercaptopyruvate sulfurtransferase
MGWTTLIGADELAHAIDDCVVVDVRHDLADVGAGRRAYDEAHVPGAFFLHMDDDLSSPKDGRNGRHPLPDRDRVRQMLEALGLTANRQLVAYDAQGGAMAARLWWLARWVGHERVAVLDGGVAAWKKAGYPLTAEVPSPHPGQLPERAPVAERVQAADVLGMLGRRDIALVDARAAERYRGDTEPLDPVAGHVPGAANRPWQSNLREDGRFKPAPVLRAEFDALLEGLPASSVLHYCGSGVTACHNLLAMEHAGLPGARLYAGSWSEWIADASRPVATGDGT